MPRQELKAYALSLLRRKTTSVGNNIKIISYFPYLTPRKTHIATKKILLVL